MVIRIPSAPVVVTPASTAGRRPDPPTAADLNQTTSRDPPGRDATEARLARYSQGQAARARVIRRLEPQVSSPARPTNAPSSQSTRADVSHVETRRSAGSIHAQQARAAPSLSEVAVSQQRENPLVKSESVVSRSASPIPDVSTLSVEPSIVDKDPLSALPNLVKKVEFTGESRRLTLGSLYNFVKADIVELTMLDGTTLMALDNTQKDERPGFNCNCFGFALTEGKFWVEVRPMSQWLNNQKVLLKLGQGETPQKGDLLVWKDGDGETAHAAIAVSSDSVVMAAGTHLYDDGKQHTVEPLGNAWRSSGGKGTLEIWRAKEQPKIS